ncbi:M16 family metallopeptidase [Cytophaga hutchinsonii]|uniref:Zinc protease n=1 Tax=Cytophaga hutchinsonii (strain ATCC 33406 / DSM 1761 / CIP 103989 / NBRC 15051 / NCIMB 9469 / D465) TaxID=269798 RepID=A0A6N4SQE2_CYTH3|nr:M16 family metallopeptidase [Cytophaga hutchinsonii]ABG58503.1 zinc protease [Cytophaga hutchinsonii ATCC 33406]SFX75809.1 Predicted Zn-dependent peptidase [Cytophaga hutchinsonii ATCC 33406]
MKHFILSIGLSIGCFSAALSQTAFETKTATDSKGRNYEYVTNDPLKARIYTLSNGLKVYLSDYKDAPRIQTYVAVRTGSKNDPATATGLAHYLEHILFKGTSKIGTSDWPKEQIELDKIEALYEVYRNTADAKKRTAIYHQIDSISVVAAGYAIANEYDKMLSQIGAQGTNAYTFVEQTVYVNDIPSNQIQKWAEIEAERFSMVVPRLFHTELEAVYEEKNKGLDNDGRKVFETTMASLFKKDAYGTQTTIGTVEHLKNPSITEIKKYFNTYYVANNMAICMSGDLNYDSTITLLEKQFSKLLKKDVPVLAAPVEEAIKIPLQATVVGPTAESVSLAYRLDVAIPKDPAFRSKLKMIQMLLTNGQAGLIDLNINQAQKAMGAYSYDLPLKDYSILMLGGKPLEGQTLEAVEALLLQQITNLKTGNFKDWLIPAVVNDYKTSTMTQFESNKARADAFVDAFVWGISWKDYINEINILQSITKQQVQDFATAYFQNNYVTVFKRKGVDSTIQKVPKPIISSVPVNRDSQSDFYKEVFKTPSPVIKPVYLDYAKELTASIIGVFPALYKQNKENALFTQQYKWDLGKMPDPQNSLMLSYLNYLGTDKYTAEQLQEEFYKLGCNYSFRIAGSELILTLSGIQDNYVKALTLLESFVQRMKGNNEALAQIKSNILKSRADNKTNKDVILRSAMAGYVKYDGINPFTNIIPEDRLKVITSEELIAAFKQLYNSKHEIVYYGPASFAALSKSITKLHKSKGESLMRIQTAYSFSKPAANKVYWVNYDMVQAEVLLLSRSVDFNKELIPAIQLYNEYFGGSMGSLVFQEMRESRALAYSVKSTFDLPYYPSDPFYSTSYIGTQADKIQEALSGMVELIDNMPKSDLLFENSKISILETIATQRVTKLGVLNDYERNKRMGYTTDIRKAIFDSISVMTFNDIHTFQQTYINKQPRIILIIGSKDKIDFNSLSEYGEVKELTLEEIFGY